MSGQAWRLASGGRIDRSSPLSFTFDGTSYQGYAGDTLASALLANGVRIAGRSFKLHRPRGIFASWSEEPNAIVQVGAGARRIPNLKASQVELRQALAVRSVNCWPSARLDAFAPLQLLARFMPAGFYYKTFMWPGWHWFEPAVRRAAGLGSAPNGPDPDHYEERHESCDVLVVGGGPAGLSAALASVRAGARVVLADDRPVLGGSLRWESHRIDSRPGLDWVAAAESELRSSKAARLLTRTTAFGFYDHNLVALCERMPDPPPGAARERLWHVRARQVVLATGAIERPLVFPGNDRPGLMLASAAMDYVVQYAVRPGRKAVFVTSGDSAYEAAHALQACGVDVAAIVDTRQAPGEPAERARGAGIVVIAGAVAVGTHGPRAVRAIDVQAAAQQPHRGRAAAARRLRCDLVCVSGGWTPRVHLYSQAGGRLRYEEDVAALVPDGGPAAVRCAGACSGRFTLADALADGFAAGRDAAREGGATADVGAAASSPPSVARVSAAWALPAPRRGAAWVDLQNDVTRADLELAVRENLCSPEHLKRYTTAGMAVDQGKTSNMNTLGLLAFLTAQAPARIAPTTFRPPYDPVTLGTLAGRRVGAFYHPLRRTPIDCCHAAQRAQMQDFGGWLRPAAYPGAGESRIDCIRREKRAARGAVSLFDASSLGKIEVRGADAASFVDLMYYQSMSTLRTGGIRYGLMLNEHGTVIDDGVCMRLAEDRFLVSTTSSGAARIAARFEEWLQCQQPGLRLLTTDVSSAWGTVVVAGPRARELMQRLETDIDLSRHAFAHLSVRCGSVGGVPARVARVGLSGELSFELSVPAGYAASLWETLMRHGAELGATPLGLDALQQLRIEKGFLIVHADTDGRTIPSDLGMDGVLARKKSDFVGRRSLERPDAKRADRLQFVGIAADGPGAAGIVLPVGAHVIEDPAARSGSQGYVTSSCFSEALGRGVALALVRAGRSRVGESIQVFSGGRTWPARIVAPGGYDPGGERMHA
jgi:sarcosine oxidase, subunit alpha